MTDKPTPPFGRVFLLVNAWICAVVNLGLVMEGCVSEKPMVLPPVYAPLFFVGAMALFSCAYILKVLHANGLSDK